MKTDDKTLDEVVVVGYGVQKKKLVTGSTIEVKGDDIQKMNTTQVVSGSAFIPCIIEKSSNS